MPWFDAGVNLTHSSYQDQMEAVLDRALAAGVEKQAVIGTCVATSQQAVALAERFPEHLVATVGVHPHDAAGVAPDYIAVLRALAQHPLVKAIGECGLDFNRNYSPPDQQRRVFRDQLALAAELNMPLYLHERDAHLEQCALLTEFKNEIPKYFTHCFTGGREALENYTQLGCYIGITGWICDERRGQDLREAVTEIPKHKLLFETDAPFLLPRSLRPKPKSRTNEPSYLPHIAEVVATLTGQSVTELEQQSWRNSLEFFAME